MEADEERGIIHALIYKSAKQVQQSLRAKTLTIIFTNARRAIRYVYLSESR